MTVRGERGVLTDQYDVTASSTLDRDPYGVPCSPDNLKKSSGYWAESVSGDGQGETLETVSYTHLQERISVQVSASVSSPTRQNPEGSKE